MIPAKKKNINANIPDLLHKKNIKNIIKIKEILVTEKIKVAANKEKEDKEVEANTEIKNHAEEVKKKILNNELPENKTEEIKKDNKEEIKDVIKEEMTDDNNEMIKKKMTEEKREETKDVNKSHKKNPFKNVINLLQTSKEDNHEN